MPVLTSSSARQAGGTSSEKLGCRAFVGAGSGDASSGTSPSAAVLDRTGGGGSSRLADDTLGKLARKPSSLSSRDRFLR